MLVSPVGDVHSLYQILTSLYLLLLHKELRCNSRAFASCPGFFGGTVTRCHCLVVGTAFPCWRGLKWDQFPGTSHILVLPAFVCQRQIVLSDVSVAANSSHLESGPR